MRGRGRKVEGGRGGRGEELSPNNVISKAMVNVFNINVSLYQILMH